MNITKKRVRGPFTRELHVSLEDEGIVVHVSRKSRVKSYSGVYWLPVQVKIPSRQGSNNKAYYALVKSAEGWEAAMTAHAEEMWNEFPE